MRRAATGLGLAILGLLAGWAVWIAIGSADLPSSGDADLAVTFVPVPDAENGIAILLAASERRNLPEDLTTRLWELRRDGKWDRDAAHALLDPNRDRLAALERALAAPHFQSPVPEEMPTTVEAARASSDRSIRLHEYGTLCAERAIAQAHEDASRWSRAVLACFELGSRLAAAPGGGIDYAVQGAGDHIQSAGTLRRTLPLLPVTAADSRRFEAELDRLRIGAEAWRAALADHHRQLKASVLRMTDEGSPLGVRVLLPWSYRFHPNQTIAELAVIHRARRDAAERTCREARDVFEADPLQRLATRATENEPKLARVKSLVRPNGLGVFLVDLWVSSAGSFERLRCGTAVAIGVAQSLIAIRAYQLERGALPPSLDALVPRYLSRVPEDFFDGAPLRYSAERKLLWSVGEDLVDGGGGDPDAPPDTERADLSYWVPL
jgi:hypothetical protein